MKPNLFEYRLFNYNLRGADIPIFQNPSLSDLIGMTKTKDFRGIMDAKSVFVADANLIVHAHMYDAAVANDKWTADYKYSWSATRFYVYNPQADNRGQFRDEWVGNEEYVTTYQIAPDVYLALPRMRLELAMETPPFARLMRNYRPVEKDKPSYPPEYYETILRQLEESDRKILEAYEGGFRGLREKEVELYRNPSRREYRSCQQYDEVRAFVVGDDVIIWNPFTAVHQMVRDHLKLPDDAISITISGSIGDEAYVMVTDNTQRTQWHHNPEVAYEIKQCEALRKMFTRIDVGYWDEGIVGDWAEIGNEEDEDDDDDLNEEVYDTITSRYSPETTKLYRNPSASEFKTLMKILRRHPDIDTSGTMRGLLNPDTGEVMIWDGYMATHGGLKDRLEWPHAFHLILTPTNVRVLTAWRYERNGLSIDEVRKIVETNPAIQRMYRRHPEIDIQP